MTGYQQFVRGADQMIAEIQKSGTAATGEASGRLKALRADLQGAARSAIFPGGGAMDEGMINVLNQMIPDPAGWDGKMTRAATMIAKLNKAKEAAKSKAAAALGAAGLPPDRLDPRSAAR